MEHLISNEGQLVLKRTAYMQYLMNSTYDQIAINAILAGTIEGAWEKAIADKLFLAVYQDQNPMAWELLELTGDMEYTKETFMKAAYLVTSSKEII
jgi:hypothetical protein